MADELKTILTNVIKVFVEHEDNIEEMSSLLREVLKYYRENVKHTLKTVDYVCTTADIIKTKLFSYDCTLD